jgi:glutaconate CoA-transferase subunit A
MAGPEFLSLSEAVQLVPTGCMLAVGGMTLYRRPTAFALELIRRYRACGQGGELTLLNFAAGYESDLLVGAGLIKQVRSCYFGLEIFGLAPMFTYYANRGGLQVLEETEASLALGLRAHLGRVGFMPSKAWLGTDLPKLRPDVRTIIDPYSGEELIAFPAIAPDVAVIHALQADLYGNVEIGTNKSADEELALAASILIVTAEEIVPELKRATLPAPFVRAIVHAPGGSRPASCHPNYAIDGQTLLEYSTSVSDPGSFERYLSGLL